MIKKVLSVFQSAVSQPQQNSAEQQPVQMFAAQPLQLTVDVYQFDGHLCIIAPVVGASLEDISITVADNTITISGNRHHQQDGVPDGNFMVKECYWGAFTRSIILPKGLKTGEINATFLNGILKIQIPQVDAVKPKVVEVKPHNPLQK